MSRGGDRPIRTGEGVAWRLAYFVIGEVESSVSPRSLAKVALVLSDSSIAKLLLSMECWASWVSDLLNEATVFPARDRVEFAKRLVFNYTIGNSDAHLKNSSLLYNEDWTSRSLAPLYDVTCIPLSTYSTRMPFDIGSHRELNEIDEHDIFKICLSADAPMDAFDAAVAEVVNGFESPRLLSCSEAVETMVSRILENSKPRLTVLKRYLESAE